MPATDRRYVVLGIGWADNPDYPEFLAVEGKIVVFDTKRMAQHVVPYFGAGRPEAWNKDRDKCYFSPLLGRGYYNRVEIWTGYDPYDVPNGFASKGVRSEAEYLDWKHHVHWAEVSDVMMAWADQFHVAHIEAATPEMPIVLPSRGQGIEIFGGRR